MNNNHGVTLAELLIAIFVLSVGVLSALLFFTNAMIATELARDITVATSDAEGILEEMQTRSSLANVTSTDWTTWAQGQGLNTLPSETYNVYFVNAASDPLDITTTVGWTKKGRSNTVVLKTMLTK